MSSSLFISVAGIIGAGKTTLSKKLSEILRIPYYAEPVDENPILPLFYKDMIGYGSTLQYWLLNERLKQHDEISKNTIGGILDRSIYEDNIFAKILMEDERNNEIQKKQYEIYLTLSQTIFEKLQKPKCILYLRVDPEIAIKRIEKRNREMELKSSGLDINYLRKLYDGYEQYMLHDIHQHNIHVIVIDWNGGYESINMDDLIDKIKTEIKLNRNITFLDI